MRIGPEINVEDKVQPIKCFTANALPLLSKITSKCRKCIAFRQIFWQNQIVVANYQLRTTL